MLYSVGSRVAPISELTRMKGRGGRDLRTHSRGDMPQDKVTQPCALQSARANVGMINPAWSGHNAGSSPRPTPDSYPAIGKGSQRCG